MKICFVAQNIYPILKNKSSVETSGGAELQQRYIGEALRDKGFSVSYVSMDHGQPDGEVVDGLRIYKSFKPEEGIIGLRFFYPRLYKIWRALRCCDADIYYVRCATFLTAILAVFCKKYRKKFIFAGAHDTDFIPNKILLPIYRDKVLYKYGLRRANAIVVQSNEQKRLLWDNFHLKCRVIHNFYPVNPSLLADSERKIILWVSTLRPWKRPMQFLRLAESFQDESFVMIGGRSAVSNEKEFFDDVSERAKNVKNLQFLGFQPFNVTESYFDKCRVFVNTSEYEGFPNTFLQAWARGIPVISCFDPDNVIKEHKLGVVVESENHLHAVMSEFLSNHLWTCKHILDYFCRNHSSKIADQYSLLLRELQ